MNGNTPLPKQPAHGSSQHATPACSSSQPSSLPARGSSQQATHDQIFQPAFAPYNTFGMPVPRPTCPARKSTGGPFYAPRNYAYVLNVFQSQTTVPLQACQTITLQDPSWNMDTGASSHLADNTCILTFFSNSIIYPYVFVGNVIPAEIGMPTYRTTAVDVVNNDEELRLNLDLLEERRELAAINEARSKSKMTKYYNSRVRGVAFQPKDFVCRSNDASHAAAGGKLGPNWEGPYEVTDALENGAYKLRSMDGTMLPRTWNVANLKRCYL
nr:reverse transcriptase domain-containing protein [Tanacetum cinerariifolium]